MAAPLLLLQDIRVVLGTTTLLDGASLAVGEGDRLCLVGRNGSGKSTLLKIAAGLMEPDAGERTVRSGATIRYLPQEPDLSDFATVLDYVDAGLAPGDDHNRAASLLGQFGLTGAEATATLSGGEARRAALARVLAPSPDVLLLDEPTNHLDLPAIEWLENELAGMSSALILISHDRRFLSRLSKTTIWLDRGRTRRLERDFAQFEAWRDEAFEQEERDYHKLDRKIATEEDWLRHGVSARRKRNQGRLEALHELRRKRREHRRATGKVAMAAQSAALSGDRVIEAKNIAKSYGDTPIVTDFSTRILRGDRVGIVGHNGAGKTTLIRLLTGKLSPDRGEVKLGVNLAISELDQGRAALDPEATLAATLTDGRGDTVRVGGEARHVVTYMKDFLFSPEQARTPVRVLSGGERGRLLLAKSLAKPSNLLVLDEPTNDLDLETLDVLQEMLADYAGTVLVVSHDRDFLDRVATSIIMAEGNGRFVEYAGGYSDMLAQRGEGVSAKAGKEPTRAKALPRARPSSDKRRLSFTEKHALETLPARITALEQQQATLQASLSDRGLYARDPKAFAGLAEKLAQVKAELEAAEERWLELEMRRQELGA
ncbi:MAG TPA: ATP-binding cassette domain-containing protein [Rhizomicrobium sp.]|nr:ATP-binding cassette domain-containing protein [Rhizomicrobium sp.]